jgi:hypothetical protein
MKKNTQPKTKRETDSFKLRCNPTNGQGEFQMVELMLGTIRETYPDNVVREVMREHSFSFKYEGKKYRLWHEQGNVVCNLPEQIYADAKAIIKTLADLKEKMEVLGCLTMLEFVHKYAKMQLDMSRKLERRGGAGFEVIEKTKLSLEQQCILELLQEQRRDKDRSTNDSTKRTMYFINKEMVDERVAQKKREMDEKAKQT